MINEKFLMNAIKTEIQAIIKEETEKAIQSVYKRVAEKTDTIALNLLQHYDVQTLGGKIIIEVRKNLK